MKILYLEDSSGDAKLLQYEFAESSPSIEIDWVDTCAAAMVKISLCRAETPYYDVILTDMNLPDGVGISLLPFLQEKEINIPLVVLTGVEDKVSAISALKAGASDYVVKNEIYLSELPGILQRAMDRHQIETSHHIRPINVIYGERNHGDFERTRKYFSLYAPLIKLEKVESAQHLIERISLPGNGVKKASDAAIDAVLLDDQLPGMMMLALIEEMCVHRKINLPVVLMSGRNNQELAIRALRLGICDYVVKTADYLDHLPGIIESAFNRYQVEREKENLRKSEEYFRMLIENASDMIATIDVSGMITYCSPSVEKLLGYRSGELINANVYHKLHPAELGKGTDLLRQSLRHPGAALGTFEFKFKRSDGKWIDLEIIGKTVFDLSGNKVIITNGRDITERKRNEQEILTSRLRLAEAMELAQIVYWEADPLTNEFIFNDSFYASLATTAEAEGGYRMKVVDYWNNFIHPDDLQSVYRIKEKIDNSIDQSSQWEHRILRRDGKIRHILNITRYIRDKDGRIIRIMGTNQDITERIEMEKALQESESKYRSLVENPLVGFFIGQDRLIRFANKRFYEMIGYTPDECLNNVDYFQMVYADDRPIVKEMYQNFRRNPESMREELRLVHKDGRIISLRIFVSPIMYQGNLAAAIMLIDQTQEKILEVQLRQSQKMEAIGALAGGIAHDFNNILTALTGYASLLKMEVERGGRPQISYLDAILSSTMKASNLTQSLLAFARQQAVTLKPVNINEVINNIKKMLMRLLTEDIELQTNLCPEETIVMADESQLDQILINMAVNARDAMPEGGVITVETKAIELDAFNAGLHGLEAAGRYVVVSVTDTGIGMDSSVRERIFEPFFTTKDIGKGTGLGLVTVYGIVKKHGGNITVDSEKGMGTVFHVYLPAINARAAETKSKPEPAGGRETILLAEDDANVRESMAILLNRFGYTVIQAVDGEDAVDRFEANQDKIDLLIFDSVMPKKNGRQAYDAISAIHPTVKVIFMSGYTRDVVLDKGIEEKKFDFLSKPVAKDILLARIREVLDR